MLKNLREILYLLRKVVFRKFSRSFYSQFGEDTALENLFDKSLDFNGFYVDVGCFHPKQFSNTYFLYKKGWRGINIDMDELKIKGFNLVRGDDINICCPVSDKKDIVKACSYGRYGLTSTIDKKLINSESAYNLRDMETNTLTNLISNTKYKDKQIDLLSIDAEGHDLQVLQSLDFSIYKPRIVIIELHSLRLDDIINSDIYLFFERSSIENFIKITN